MIARRWHGIVPKDKADAYLKLMLDVAIPDYRSVAGNRGAWCLRRAEGDVVHFEMLTFWDNLDVIEGFAGTPVDAAKYYDFDDDFLIEKEAHVLHFEVNGTL
ncbi:hypothetical protein FG91_02374 [Sphingopyxis sp. LC81]|uniref:hypothetical protein n=1 Tax=Sphingopyxis sp. LC81 TaxID=1502850 RepID=UPI00050DC6E2|nr:hypothetical protein [Sphingopyxis sp. LC81]KGB54125.1 hypothetical protein FG91_02374 [Sphingopyxis sp. LC81]